MVDLITINGNIFITYIQLKDLVLQIAIPFQMSGL